MTRYHLLTALAFALGLALPAVALWGHEPAPAEGPIEAADRVQGGVQAMTEVNRAALERRPVRPPNTN